MRFLNTLLYFILIVSPASAANYVVGSGGDYADLAAVNAASFNPDDDICFLGEHFSGSLLPPSSGSLGYPITLRSCDPNNKAVIDYITVDRKHDLVFKDLKSLGLTSNDIWAFSGAYNILIDNPYIDCQGVNGAIGIQAYRDLTNSVDSHDIEISGGVVMNCGEVTGTQNGAGISFVNSVYNTNVHHVSLINNYGYGYQCADGSGAPRTYQMYNNTITDSYVYSDQGIIGIAREGINCGYNNREFVAARNYVEGYEDNLATDGYNYDTTSWTCAWYNNVSVGGGTLGRVATLDKNTRYISNTFIGTASTYVAMNYSSGAGSDGHVYKNNVTRMPTAVPQWRNFQRGTDVVVDSDYNLFWRGTSAIAMGDGAFLGAETVYTTLAAWSAATGLDTHSVEADPSLDAEYKITVSSPAKDSGLNMSAYFVDDKDGNARIGLWEIGAYAYSTAGTVRMNNVKLNNVSFF